MFKMNLVITIVCKIGPSVYTWNHLELFWSFTDYDLCCICVSAIWSTTREKWLVL